MGGGGALIALPGEKLSRAAAARLAAPVSSVAPSLDEEDEDEDEGPRDVLEALGASEGGIEVMRESDDGGDQEARRRRRRRGGTRSRPRTRHGGRRGRARSGPRARAVGAEWRLRRPGRRRARGASCATRGGLRVRLGLADRRAAHTGTPGQPAAGRRVRRRAGHPRVPHRGAAGQSRVGRAWRRWTGRLCRGRRSRALRARWLGRHQPLSGRECPDRVGPFGRYRRPWPARRWSRRRPRSRTT